MDVTLQVLEQAGEALLGLLMQPYYYVGLLLLMLYFYWQMKLERRMFHVKLHSPSKRWLLSVLWGWAVGLTASVPMLFLGSLLQVDALLWLWTITLILSLFRIRFLCFTYATGILTLLHAIAVIIEDMEIIKIESSILLRIWESLTMIHAPSLLALIAILHLLESLLMKLQAAEVTTPIYIESKRGKTIGAMQFQAFWIIPVFLLVPDSSTLSLAWTPWFSGPWQEGWAWITFPVLIGFSEWSRSQWPEPKLRRSAKRMLMYSVVVLAMAIGAEMLTWLIIPAAVAILVMHEFFIVRDRFHEEDQPPMYVHDERGLLVLDVIPGSPAEELGISSGEVLRRVNGKDVRSQEMLHQAIRENAAFIKLEVINRDDESKFLQRAMYEGEHHQLGIILSPDDETQRKITAKKSGLLAMFK